MESITFMTSLLTFYLKGKISHEQNFIKLSQPNTILTLIPLGSKKETIAISQIASVETSFKLVFKDFLLGVIAFFIGLGVMSDSVFTGLILMLTGAGMVINSFQTLLTINTTAGQTKLLSFLIFEKSKAELAADNINRLVSNRLDDTNNRNIIAANNANTDRLVDAINSK